MYIHWVLMAFMTFSFKYHLPDPTHPRGDLLLSSFTIYFLLPNNSPLSILFSYRLPIHPNQYSLYFLIWFTCFFFSISRTVSIKHMFSATLSWQTMQLKADGPWKQEASWGSPCSCPTILKCYTQAGQSEWGWAEACCSVQSGLHLKVGQWVVVMGSTYPTSTPAKAIIFRARRNGVCGK